MHFKHHPLEESIVEKASNDPAFRAKLLADPQKAIEEMTGQALPADLSIEVLEIEHHKTYIVLPPVEADEMLTDQELETIAAGAKYTYDGYFTC
jgi:hypothetical protein